MKVKVIGAGSIGNHLTQACRTMGWNVIVTDVDPKALERMKTDIYPSRYGSWDKEIGLFLNHEAPKDNWDLVIIGTPPDTHLKLMNEIADREHAKVILVEKPFCSPDLENLDATLKKCKDKNIAVLTGYNHCTTPNTQFVEELLKTKTFGKPLTMTANIREHWEGIFKAHPWLNGPHETYLGYYTRGGGALGEHSHGVNIWQYMAHAIGAGKVTKVSAMGDYVEANGAKYDSWMSVNVATETGFKGVIVQDVVTKPTQKNLRIQFEQGFIEWYINFSDGNDAVKYQVAGEAVQEKLFPKKRPDDFLPEIKVIGEYLNGNKSRFEKCAEAGIEAMMIVAAAYKSSLDLKPVSIDYKKGYTPAALA